MRDADLTASTPATRADAWSAAEHTALTSATRLENDARLAREQAGELAGRPDMQPAAQRLDDEATAAERDAATRRGLAQGYATLRALQGGEPATPAEVVAVSASSAPAVVDDGDDEEDNDGPVEPEIFTHCYECGEPLAEPTTDEEKSVHDDCDISKPDRFWWGNLTADGTKINRDECEGFRSPKHLADELLDGVLEWEEPYGASFVELEDGTVIDARVWIEQPEHLALTDGREQYDGRGEFDPQQPDRCWSGQTLPSGGIARPCARSYDNVADMAADVCRGTFAPGSHGFDSPHTAMLPGGELVDAAEWAHRPEVRQLAGYLPVTVDPEQPERCWIGPPPRDEPDAAPIEKLASPYNDEAALAVAVCHRVFKPQLRGRDRIGSNTPLVVVLPDGELVNAYEWAQRPKTQALAGYAPIEVDPTEPDRCWLGRSSDGAMPVRQLATPYDNVAALANAVCVEIFKHDRIHSSTDHVVVLPSGEIVDAYNWAQQPETRALAGCAQVRNRIEFEASAHCSTCDLTTSYEVERTMQGKIGEQILADGIMSCDRCRAHLSITPVPVTLIDDASGATDQPMRRV